MDKEWLRDLFEYHRFKVLGGLSGLVLALFIMRFGFLWTLFILACIGIGYWIGRELDEEPDSITRMMDRMMPPGGR